MELMYVILLAFGLAVVCGLRAFAPLFLVALVARLAIPVPYAGSHVLVMLTSDAALLTLFVGAVLEVVLDAVPLLDSGLQVLHFVLRPLAGGLAAYAVVSGQEQAWVAAWIAGLLALLVTLPVHTVSTGLRVTSTTTTAGLANPLVSLVETISSVLGTLAAIFVAPLALLLGAVAVFSIYRYLRFRRERAIA